MHILIVEPEHRPRPAEIDGTVESMQEIVGGKIQAMYPTEDIAVVFNNDPNGPLLPQNRAVRNDIIRGTFFLCGAPEKWKPLRFSDGRPAPALCGNLCLAGSIPESGRTYHYHTLQRGLLH